MGKHIKEMNVLIVEDGAVDFSALQRIVCCVLDLHCTCTQAPTMAAARHLLLDEHRVFDLILLDLGLPDTKGGVDTFRGLRSVPHQIPVVVLTGDDDHEIALQILAEGGQDYVCKSAVLQDPPILRNVIDFALSRHRVMRKLEHDVEEMQQTVHWLSGGYSLEEAEKS